MPSFAEPGVYIVLFHYLSYFKARDYYFHFYIVKLRSKYFHNFLMSQNEK